MKFDGGGGNWIDLALQRRRLHVMSYEGQNEEQMVLEGMVDRIGLRQVLQALEQVMFEKAEHVRSNWQDYPLAKELEQNGRLVGKTADKVKL